MSGDGGIKRPVKFETLTGELSFARFHLFPMMISFNGFFFFRFRLYSYMILKLTQFPALLLTQKLLLALREHCGQVS